MPYVSIADMYVAFLFRRLIVALAWLGIVLAPVGLSTAASAMAAAASHQVADMVAMDSGTGVSCCPGDEQVKPGNCDASCPLSLICSSTVIAGECLPDAWQAMPRFASAFRLGPDRQLSPAIVEPPPHPPKA